MSLLGRAHFTPVQVERWKRAHRPTPEQSSVMNRLRAARQQILIDWRFGIVALPLAVAALVVARTSSIARFLALMLLAQLVCWVGFTHLQGRFFVLAIPIAALLMAQVSWPGWSVIASLGSLVSAIMACVLLAPRVMRATAVIGLDDYLRLEQPRWFMDGSERRLIDRSILTVLVGDARAFRYMMPMGKLRYRTVFDVPEYPIEPWHGIQSHTLIFAWIGNSIPEGAQVVVDELELGRFAATYWRIPRTYFGPPDSVLAPSAFGEPVVVYQGRQRDEWLSYYRDQW
jgi:hypothetical protein